jgi:SOS-response transcriptional repressor LexA
MEKLTPKEQLVYDYIVDTIRREGYSPSVRDIASAVDMKSTSTVHHYIGRLEAKGYIQKESGKSRTLRIEKRKTIPQIISRFSVALLPVSRFLLPKTLRVMSITTSTRDATTSTICSLSSSRAKA